MNKLKTIGLPAILLAGSLVLCSNAGIAQNKPQPKDKAPATDTAKAKTDTAKAKSLAALAAAKPATGIKPYKEVVPATAKTMKSFITVHLVTDRYLFEIP